MIILICITNFKKDPKKHTKSHLILIKNSNPNKSLLIIIIIYLRLYLF